MQVYLKSLVFIFVLGISSYSQVKELRIHDRGMLHETVYNTGEIGRAWETGEAGNKTSRPVFEWPPNSQVITQSIEYSGQHNMLGAGIYMAANPDGMTGKENRIYALCGGVGESSPEVTVGKWSFPIFINEVENFPLLENGDLNTEYDPNEAEEIITAQWATPLGVTVTRTSRAWSYPDYDDMIIYEYTLEYTGDTDGDPNTIERTETLKDFMALFIYGFAPSMYGYQRWYNEWKYEDGIYRGDQNGFWDADYWLSFNLNLRTEKVNPIWAKPEPIKELFLENALTGNNGGGLTSPQAPGYCILYYDTTHLAIVDTIPELNESEAVRILRTVNGEHFELDENKHIKQPWSNKVSTGNTRSSKMEDQSINPDNRWSGVYSEGSTTWSVVPNGDTDWWGRAAYNYRQSIDAGQKHIVFGPYTLEHGDKLEFSLAEVVGYGGTPGKRIEGTTGTALVQWNNTPSWNRIVYGTDGSAWTDSGYIDQFGYPDYVNSDVVTVTQVAHKAFEAYLGRVIPLDSTNHQPAEGPFWPETHPRDGSYSIPVPVPAPSIVVVNTPLAETNITWKRSVENFTHPRLSAALAGFRVWRSISGMGPWELLAEKSVGDVNTDDLYEYIDTDENFEVGENRFYAVTSIDANGFESGKTNIFNHEKNIGAVDELGKVYVVPNPFVFESGFTGGGGVVDQIGFYGLPKKCTIRIFSYAGQLVEKIEHDVPIYQVAWLQVTRNGQDIASGIYFFVVTTPEGKKESGKFIVIK